MKKSLIVAGSIIGGIVVLAAGFVVASAIYSDVQTSRRRAWPKRRA